MTRSRAARERSNRERCAHCGMTRRDHRLVAQPGRAGRGLAVGLHCAGSSRRYRGQTSGATNDNALPMLVGSALGGMPGLFFGLLVGTLGDVPDED